MVPQFLWAPLGNDALCPFVEHDHPVGNRLDAWEFMGDDDERDVEMCG